MAIAYDTSVDGGLGNPVSSHNWGHTTAGSDRWLGVACFGDTSDLVTGATYNGVAMSLVDKAVSGAGGRWVYLFELRNPAVGANTVVINASAPIAIHGMSVSLTGVHQTTSLNASNTGIFDGSTASQTVSVVPNVDNTWSVMVTRNEPVGAFSGGTGTTLRQSSGSGLALTDSNGPISPAASNDLIINTASPSTRWASVIASIAPTGAAAPRFILGTH